MIGLTSELLKLIRRPVEKLRMMEKQNINSARDWTQQQVPASRRNAVRSDIIIKVREKATRCGTAFSSAVAKYT
jgi:hypothetical protein